jgi:hypothetical protein
MQTQSNEQIKTSDVVGSTSSNDSFDFSFDLGKCESAIPIGNIFHQHDPSYYAVLEHHYINFHKETGIVITTDGIIDRISLIDFPQNQYTLSYNKQNCATAQFCIDSGVYEFNFTDKQSSTLTNLIYQQSHSARTPSIPLGVDRTKYLDCARGARIYCSNLASLTGVYHLSLHGYFPPNKWEKGAQYVEQTRTFTVNPSNTYSIPIGFPTESIDVETNQSGTIILQFDGYDCVQFPVKKDLTRIKFNNPKRLLEDRQNGYLSDKINRSTINLSNTIVEILAIDCNITSIYVHNYGIYHYPSYNRAFTS